MLGERGWGWQKCEQRVARYRQKLSITVFGSFWEQRVEAKQRRKGGRASKKDWRGMGYPRVAGCIWRLGASEKAGWSLVDSFIYIYLFFWWTALNSNLFFS